MLAPTAEAEDWRELSDGEGGRLETGNEQLKGFIYFLSDRDYCFFCMAASCFMPCIQSSARG